MHRRSGPDPSNIEQPHVEAVPTSTDDSGKFRRCVNAIGVTGVAGTALVMAAQVTEHPPATHPGQQYELGASLHADGIHPTVYDEVTTTSLTPADRRLASAAISAIYNNVHPPAADTMPTLNEMSLLRLRFTDWVAKAGGDLRYIDPVKAAPGMAVLTTRGQVAALTGVVWDTDTGEKKFIAQPGTPEPPPGTPPDAKIPPPPPVVLTAGEMDLVTQLPQALPEPPVSTTRQMPATTMPQATPLPRIRQAPSTAPTAPGNQPQPGDSGPAPEQYPASQQDHEAAAKRLEQQWRAAAVRASQKDVGYVGTPADAWAEDPHNDGGTCAKQVLAWFDSAGIHIDPHGNFLFRVGPTYTGGSMQEDAEQYYDFYSRGDAGHTPQPGDLVIFRWSPTDYHVEMVTQANPDGSLETRGGDTYRQDGKGPLGVYEHTWPNYRSNSQIVGIADFITKQARSATAHAKPPISSIPEQQPGTPIYHYDINTSALTPSGLSINQLNQLLKGTGMEGLGGALHQIEHEYGINALFAMMFAWNESADPRTGNPGSSQIAQGKNNLFGWGADNAHPYRDAYSFKTKADCILQWGKWLKRAYLTRGGDYFTGTSIVDIFNHYSTDGVNEAMKIVWLMNNQGLQRLGLYR